MCASAYWPRILKTPGGQERAGRLQLRPGRDAIQVLRIHRDTARARRKNMPKENGGTPRHIPQCRERRADVAGQIVLQPRLETVSREARRSPGTWSGSRPRGSIDSAADESRGAVR